ncbi:Glyoxalase-like domain-containing protein [Carex littledalei]|uniref:Glyoxalase-like domain-containing protein n=1 Tax=Carex littledalei TaxID=544730 RepID=A0A833VE79_9POAL|nr:Glyoxalase-like domain-containing protein [Carex littledalei]
MGLDKQEIPSLFLPLLSLNHVSFLCTSVDNSVKFYQELLGFELIKRPASLNFEGAWLHKYGISIHLLQKDSGDSNTPNKQSEINPKSNHISFQCENIDVVRKKLGDVGKEYVSAVVKDGDILVDQIFFHDPDGNTIEICNCQKLPVVPLSPGCHVNMTPP